MGIIKNSKPIFVKKDSTFPEVNFSLSQDLREKLDITNDMMENVAVTFSMIDAETGIYRIANKEAKITIKKNIYQHLDDNLYELKYRFTEKDTSKIGIFFGEFVIDFLDENFGCGKLKLPLDGFINIIIQDSITKTTIL